MVPVVGLDLHFCPLGQKLRFRCVQSQRATLIRVAFRWVRVRFQQRIKATENVSFSMAFIGAGDRTRTGTLSPAVDFESTTSTIPSHRRVFIQYSINQGKLQGGVSLYF